MPDATETKPRFQLAIGTHVTSCLFVAPCNTGFSWARYGIITLVGLLVNCGDRRCKIAAQNDLLFNVMFCLQELLPDHLLKEAKVAADKSKGTGVQWPFGWGKKKSEKELEALPTPEAEVLKVWHCELLWFNASATLVTKAQIVHCSCLDLKGRAAEAHAKVNDATVFGFIVDNVSASDWIHDMGMAPISLPHHQQ